MFAPNLTVTDLSFNRNQENLSASTESRIQLTQPKEKHNEPQPVTHIEAKLIDNCCRGGEYQIKVNDLDSEKLLEIMDYWWKNVGI